MVFCPEEGDPAIIKPKLYLDRDQFEAVSGQAFLVEGRGEDLRVTSKVGWETEIPLLTDLLRAREGLPLG
jgi:putative selenate reductase